MLQTFQVAFKTTHTLTVKAPLKTQHFLGWNMATVFTTQSRSYTTVYNRPFSIITTSRWQRSTLRFSLTIAILQGAGKYTLLLVSCHHRGGMKKGRKICRVGTAGCNRERARFPQTLQNDWGSVFARKK